MRGGHLRDEIVKLASLAPKAFEFSIPAAPLRNGSWVQIHGSGRCCTRASLHAWLCAAKEVQVDKYVALSRPLLFYFPLSHLPNTHHYQALFAPLLVEEETKLLKENKISLYISFLAVGHFNYKPAWNNTTLLVFLALCSG